ncbi:MAG: phosphoglyceromutase [Rheinheimera sp.]|nr:MAG: phosphoglyceromutase [Rheinheimera sp.]
MLLKLSVPWLCLFACSSLLKVQAAPAPAVPSPKVVLVSIDGLRWQEVFHGADPEILRNSQFIRHADQLEELPTSPQQLMPFVHQTIASQGMLVGDRRRGSAMQVSNPWHFSYPGYNELLSGYPDPAINSNGKIANPNVTVLEWLNQQPGMNQQVAAFGSWDVLPYILNTGRSKLPVNAGFAPMSEQMAGPLTPQLKLLNQLQRQTPSPWAAVRLDVFTQQFALEYLTRKKPRLLYIAYGETDDFAHDGQYDQYLKAIRRTDGFIKELWQQLQSDPFYAGQTTLLISTDHGRGDSAKSWQHHASGRAIAGYMKKLKNFGNGVSGSDEIWLAALGPQIPARGLVQTQQPWSQSQVASTVAELLGYDYQAYQYKAAAAIPLGTTDAATAQLAGSSSPLPAATATDTSASAILTPQ